MPIERILSPAAGLNTDSAQDYIGKDQAFALTNLLGRPGYSMMRGPITTSVGLGLSAPERILGTLTQGDTTFVSYMAPSSGIAKTSGTLLRWSGSFTRTGFTVDDTTAPMGRGVQLGGWCYGLSASRGLILLSGSSAPSKFTTAPFSAAADLAVHLQRVFVLTSDLGGDAALYWSDAGGPGTTDTLAMWQDDVSGLTNKIVIGGNVEDVSTALGLCGRSLAIFKRRAIYLLTGSSPSSWSVQRADGAHGCIDRNSVVSWGDGVFFLSQSGFYYFDGSATTEVSESIRSTLLAAIATSAPSSVGNPRNSGFADAAYIGSGLILLVIGSQAANSYPTITFSGLYDTARHTWTTFSSSAMTSGAPGAQLLVSDTTSTGFNKGAVLAWEGQNYGFLDSIGTPEQSAESLRGQDSIGSLTSKPIPASYSSRLIRLSSPTAKSIIKRLHLEYTFVIDGAVTEGSGWYAMLRDGANNVVMPEFQVTAQTDPPTQVRPKRFVQDVNNETDDVQLHVEWRGSGPGPALVRAELGDAYIEYSPGQVRGSY